MYVFINSIRVGYERVVTIVVRALHKYPHDTYLCHPRRILLTISELRPLN
jgi:hypothetical protein